MWLCASHRTHHLTGGSANLACKGPGDRYFQLCGSRRLCSSYSRLPLDLCPRETALTKPGSGMGASCVVHQPRTPRSCPCALAALWFAITTQQLRVLKNTVWNSLRISFFLEQIPWCWANRAPKWAYLGGRVFLRGLWCSGSSYNFRSNPQPLAEWFRLVNPVFLLSCRLILRGGECVVLSVGWSEGCDLSSGRDDGWFQQT